MKTFRILILIVMVLPFLADNAWSDATIELIDWDQEITQQVQLKRIKAPVDIYVTSWCPYCRKAISYLNANGIKFNKYDIEDDLSAAARKKQLAPNYNGIPLAVINGKIVKGFNKDTYKAALQQ